MRAPATGAKQAECVRPKISLAEINPFDQSSNGIDVSVSGVNDFLTSFYPNDAGRKKSRAAGWVPAGAARSMATTFYCGSSLLMGEAKKLLTNAQLTSQAARRLKTATRALVKELVQTARTWLVAAAFGVFLRLEVTHINVLFLLFAHITFLSCVFGFGLCQSRRIVAVPLRPSRLGSGRPSGSAYLSNASAVELRAPQNRRPSFPSTNSQAPY
jgi:hypothetical protein